METKNLQITLGFVILFLLFAGHLQAAEWVFCESNPSGHLYYDKSSILKARDMAQVRTMAILNDDGKAKLNDALKKIGKTARNADTVSYSISSEEFDCLKRKLKISSMTIYNEKGGAIHTLAVKNDDWENIIPETNGDILAKIVCSGSK
jgi:hypothetical protein